jgi:hypothetical protein
MAANFAVSGSAPLVFTPAPDSIFRITADLVIAAAAMRRIEQAGIQGQCHVVQAIRDRGLSVDDMTMGQLIDITNEVLP